MSKNSMYVSSNQIENLFHNILYQAENFEMKTGCKPTIFITPDMFTLLAANYKYELRVAATNESDTFCGYPTEQIKSNKGGVFIGYKILEADTSAE